MMDLWIRSQDKMNLVKVNQICVNYQNNNEIIENYRVVDRDNDDYQILGTYEAKERALEVLNEIQRHLAYLEQMVDAGRAMELDFESDFIYEMPGE